MGDSGIGGSKERPGSDRRAAPGSSSALDCGEVGVGRAVDRLAGVVALAVAAPLAIARAAMAERETGRVFDEHRRLGRAERPIVIRSFAGTARGRRIPYALSLIVGDLRVIGPRPLHPADVIGRRDRDPAVEPGLLSPQRLRARTGIAYGVAEDEPIDQALFRPRNLALVARYVVAELLGGGGRPTPERFDLLGVELDNSTMDETLHWAVQQAQAARTAVLTFVNPDCLNQAIDNAAYRDVLSHADRVMPDGIGIKVATGFQGIDVRENVNGTDMFPLLCEQAAENDLSLFLLGARDGVASAAASEMQRRYPTLRIAGTHHGYFGPTDEAEVIDRINASGADILLVAFGVPLQEIWLDRHRDALRAGLVLGVGGLFDFYSGRIPRAPRWVREVGMEWAWRLAQEPRRMWRRYVIGNPLFLSRAWRDARNKRATRPTRPERPGLLGYGYYGDEGRP
ncbi:WecB/TagA/CpsF family glycosyltransferase [Agilicoccus flavus]|uniref:WecB/TagA/CpsF family glycosyltransferase n=1 Tax=Agilicoccus flavus TaxID=2775968 RepID=UPI001CF71567|nr:WecB/TagA/CpsF family glycosyltransferase [Agilicoccus flavus]